MFPERWLKLPHGGGERTYCCLAVDAPLPLLSADDPELVVLPFVAGLVAGFFLCAVFFAGSLSSTTTFFGGGAGAATCCMVRTWARNWTTSDSVDVARASKEL